MSSPDQHDGCCPSPSQKACAVPPAPPGSRSPRGTTLSAVLLGVLASACCWLPLLLAGLGVAGGALGARVAFLRPWALWGLGLLLTGLMAWWIVKRFGASTRREDCCAVAPRFPTLPVIVLLLSFAGAASAPRLLDHGRGDLNAGSVPTPPKGSSTWVLATPQFDCAPCAGALPQRLTQTPGVASVQMDFQTRQTRIVFKPGANPEAILTQWNRNLGFSGSVLEKSGGS